MGRGDIEALSMGAYDDIEWRPQVIDAMAAVIWRAAGGTGTPPKKLVRPGLSYKGGAPAMAARDLADLWEDANDANLEDLCNRLNEQLVAERHDDDTATPYDARNFGRLIAMQSLGMARMSLIEQLVVPTFRVELDDDELVWNGEVPAKRNTPRQRARAEDDEKRLVAGMRERGVSSYRDIKELLDVNEDSPMPGQSMRLLRRLERDSVIQKRPDGFWVVLEPSANPSGQFTAKGERMYDEVRSQYEAKGDPRAREIAARTVYARAADGVPGLIHRHGKPPGVPNHRKKA